MHCSKFRAGVPVMQKKKARKKFRFAGSPQKKKQLKKGEKRARDVEKGPEKTGDFPARASICGKPARISGFCLAFGPQCVYNKIKRCGFYPALFNRILPHRSAAVRRCTAALGGL